MSPFYLGFSCYGNTEEPRGEEQTNQKLPVELGNFPEQFLPDFLSRLHALHQQLGHR